MHNEDGQPIGLRLADGASLIQGDSYNLTPKTRLVESGFFIVEIQGKLYVHENTPN